MNLIGNGDFTIERIRDNKYLIEPRDEDCSGYLHINRDEINNFISLLKQVNKVLK